MGVSGGTAGSSRKERDDGVEIRHSSKRSDYWRLLEGACEGRTEDPEVTRDLEILESMFRKQVYGQGVLRGERDLPGASAGTLEYANQPPTGFVLGYPSMCPAYMFSRGVEMLRVDGYLTLILLTHGELTTFHRLMKYGDALSVRKAHPSSETYPFKCAARLKTLLVEYLLMQSRCLTGEERSAKTREEVREANGGIPLLTDLCLVMRSDPVGMIRGLGEVVTCAYGPAETYAFPDPLVAAYRHSVVHVRREPDQRSEYDGTKLVPTRRHESANE